MGHTVDNPIRTTHPRIIDYAARRGSDFDDIYLISHANSSSAHLRVTLSRTASRADGMANLFPSAWPSWLKSIYS